MSEKVYIEFDDTYGGSFSKPSKFQRIVTKLLATIIPKANPDFEHLLDSIFPLTNHHK
jgi:hypothetical protein